MCFLDGAVMVRAKRLAMNSMTREMAGIYTCVASNQPLGVTTSRNESIQVHVNCKCNKQLSGDII